MFFISKQKKIETQLGQYRQIVAQCVEMGKTALQRYCQNQDRGELQQNFLQVNKAESRADDIRREIEVMMYSKSVFPESRGDILGMLESLDKVPNQAEATVRMMLTHHIVIPETFHDKLLELMDISHRCVIVLLDAAAKLFTDFTTATVDVGKVDSLESQADHLEAELFDHVFRTPEIDDLSKILLRDLIKNISAISDRAENAGDRIRIIIAKRSV